MEEKSEGEIAYEDWLVANAGIEDQVCWTTKKGKRIPIMDMEDDHLLNAFPFARRAAARAFRRLLLQMELYEETAPDGAADCVRGEIDQLAQAIREDFDGLCRSEQFRNEPVVRTYLHMKREIARRLAGPPIRQ